MTKPLPQIQEENRRAILCAIYGVSYEEALEKELGFGCALVRKKDDKSELIEKFYCEDAYAISDGSFGLRAKDIKDFYQIIGRPLTLSRVLLALKNEIELEPDISHNYLILGGAIGTPYINWNLTLETLEEQSKETQIAIWKLLGGGE